MAPSTFRALALAVLFIVLSTTQLPSLAAASRSHDLLMLDRFHRWMSTHGRVYGTADEKLRRFEVYRRNVEFIDASNRDGKVSYKLGENQFTDLTHEEFVSKYARAFPPPLTKDDNAVADDDDMVITTLTGNVSEGHGRPNVDAPDSFDWRPYGVVTPVKDQGPCGSCWAFSAVATLESMIIRYGGPVLDLSEQQLVDCDLAESGCYGGWPNRALEWTKANSGLVTEEAYKYAARQGTCKNTTGIPRWGAIGAVVQVPSLDELALKSAVWVMPVSVVMDASGLQYYLSGVFDGPCTTTLNHAVVFVGWGVDAYGNWYWIAKNSWGTGWGENGYFRIRREFDGQFGPGLCGLAIANYYPLM